MFDKVLRHLPQPAAPHRRARARQPRLGAPGRQPGSVGEGDREAARRLDAAARTAAARCRHLSRGGELRWRHDIDRAWAANPNPGRISAVHRLNRTEYNNAIRDLFALDVDVKSLLPGDETADGSFDNFADVALDLDGAPRALPVGRASGHAARDRPAAGEPDASRRSRFRCTSCRTIGRARICRSDRAAASRFATTFRSTAST